MSAARLATVGLPGLIGKTPAQGDFVRIHTGDATVQAFSGWLETAHDLLHAQNLTLARAPTCFVYAPQGKSTVLVGAWVPGQDRVGRTFPLVAFVPVDASSVAAGFSMLPLVFSEFLGAAARLLDDAGEQRIATASLGDALRLLPLPDAAAWERAQAHHDAILGLPSRLLIEAFFESGTEKSGTEGDLSGAAYALRTFRLACLPDQGREPTRTRVVLDCPAVPGGPLVWLELASRLLRWPNACPSFSWSEAPTPRMLLSLGTPPPHLLLYGAKPGARGSYTDNTLWPLRTVHASARDAALAASSEPQLAALRAPGQSLDALLQAFAL